MIPEILTYVQIPFAEETTYGVAWAVMGLIDGVLFLGVIACMWKGESWREKLGPPDFDKDL